MLEAQCGHWGGITSAAVYWPLFVSNGTEHAADLQVWHLAQHDADSRLLQTVIEHCHFHHLKLRR